MTTVIEANEAVRRPRTSRTVSVAGVAWPAYKLHAALATIVVGFLVFAITRSAEITAWVAAATALTVWLGEPHLPRKSVGEPAANPRGIS